MLFGFFHGGLNSLLQLIFIVLLPILELYQPLLLLLFFHFILFFLFSFSFLVLGFLLLFYFLPNSLVFGFPGLLLCLNLF